MPRRAFLTAAVLALTTAVQPAMADTAGDLRSAFEIFLPNGVDQESATMATLSRIPQMTGSWTFASLLFPDANYVEETAARSCMINRMDIAPTGGYGFTMTRVRRDVPTEFVTTFTIVAGSTFTRSTDIDGAIADLFGPGAETVPPSTLLSLPRNAGWQGLAQVHLVSPNVLVIESVGAAPEIFTRCP